MPDGGTLARRARVLNLPNMVTFARLLAVPGAVWLVGAQRWGEAAALFALAGLSDALDGYLARRLGGSALGAALDPLADKALVIGMLVTLASMGRLPVWLAALVVARDVVMVGGIAVLRLRGTRLRIAPVFVSKVNTALQLVLIGLTLALAACGVAAPLLLGGLALAVAATTLASCVAYARVLR